MILEFGHQKQEDMSLFGLLFSRAVYEGAAGRGRTGKEPAQTATAPTQAPAKRPKKKETPSAIIRSEVLKQSAELKREIDEYNGLFDPDLSFNPKRSMDTQKQIRTILTDLKKQHRAPGISAEKTEDLETQMRYLESIDELIVDFRRIKRNYSEINRNKKKPNERLARAVRLRLAHERLTRAGEGLETWKKRPLYQTVMTEFNQESGRREFAEIFLTPYGVEGQAQQEARQLFLAIMARETNDFQHPFFFGPEFQEDYAENIKHFPFIYHEWFEKVGGTVSFEGIEEAENKVHAAEVRLQLDAKPIPDIINRAGMDSGLDMGKYQALKATPPDEAWGDRVALIEDFIQNLKAKKRQAQNNKDTNRARSYETLIQELQAHKEYAQAQVHYHEIARAKIEIDKKFTRQNFRSKDQQRFAIKLAMLKFKKAWEMVKHPMGKKADWQKEYHPTVRRLLVAHFYGTGVSSYHTNREGHTEYRENISNRKAAMLAALVRSKHFSSTENNGSQLDPDRRRALLIINYGFQALNFLENTQDVGPIIEKVLAIKEAKRLGNKRDADRLAKELSYYPRKFVSLYMAMSVDDLNKAQSTYNDDRKAVEEYVKDTEELLKNPKSAKAQAIIAKYSNREIAAVQVKMNRIAKLNHLSGADMVAFDADMKRIESDFLLQEHETPSDLKDFEVLGLRLEGLYFAYQDALADQPDMAVENWSEHMKDPEKFKKLIEFLDKILPPTKGEGKKDLIASLELLAEDDDLEMHIQTPENASNHAAALAVLTMIKGHLLMRERIGGRSEAKQQEIEQKLKGMHVGDFVSDYVGGAWGMLTGSGESLANRAAGGVLLYLAYRAARKAIKGDGPMGKALRIGFIAGALEIFLKEHTGQGLLDRAGFDPLESAFEETYEAVLVQEGVKTMAENAITTAEHQKCLQNMRDIPFATLMEWYGQRDSSGKLRVPEKGAFGGKKKGKDRAAWKLPKGLRPNDILVNPENNLVDDDKRACLILYKTMESFITYVGNKDNNRGYEHGLNVIQERWIDLIEDPDKEAQYTEVWFPYFAEKYRGNLQGIKWRHVVEAELDPHDVERTKHQTLVGQAEEMVAEATETVSEWTSHYAGQFQGHAEEFFTTLGSVSRETSKAVGELVDTGANKLYFTKKSMELWYGAHKYTIQRVAEQHWEMVVTGVTLPFKVIYGVDQAVMPFALSKLKQVEQVLAYSHQENITGDLTAADIFAPRGPNVNPGSSNVELNPKYTFFGEYQRYFMIAHGQADRFYEDRDNKIGYHISEMTVQEAGINMNDTTYKEHPENVDRDMLAKSREKAVNMFVKQTGMDPDQVRKYMYRIHRIDKTATPRKMYVFWRLPLTGSEELRKKQNGEWADYADPNRYKDREAYALDPSKTRWENLVDAMSLGMDPVRGIVSGVGGYAVQLPRWAFGIVETGGEITSWIAQRVGDRTQQEREQIDEAIKSVTHRTPFQQQWMDEFFTSAKSPALSISEFYDDPVNSELYRFSLDYAHEKDKRMYTGLLIGRDGYEEPHLYDRKPDANQFQKMQVWFRDVWSQTGRSAHNTEIERILADKVAEEGRGELPTQQPQARQRRP